MNRKILLMLIALAFASLPLHSQVKTQDSTVKTMEGLIDTTDIIYIVVEEQASFPGGMDSLFKYLSENLKYPEEETSQEMTATVYVEFVVEKDGSITNVRIRHSKAHPSMDNAAIEAVKRMPAWNPGRQRGKAVRSLFVLPVYVDIR